MYSAYKLNKQGDSIQPWHTPFPIWNQSVGPCPVLTVASWPAYRFLRRQVRWSGTPISLRIFHSLLWSTVKGFGIISKAEVNVFLVFSCFLNDWCNSQVSPSVVYDSLQPHGQQHHRAPCQSPTPRACSNSHPMTQWCHPAISFSVLPFSFCLQSLPASGSFQGVSTLHQVTKLLEFQLWHQSFQWIFRTDLL